MRVNVARSLWPVVWPYQRRVMLALLAATLSGIGLSAEGTARTAWVRTGRALKVITRLEHLGWLEGTMEERADGKHRRRVYTLTGDGGARVAELLGLFKAGTAREVTAR